MISRNFRRSLVPIKGKCDFTVRTLSSTQTLRNDSSISEDTKTTTIDSKAGKFATTDESITNHYPGHGFKLRADKPDHHGGRHYNRTLSSFSLEGKVCVVTGAARGLGYTMTQAFIESGAEVAIIDLDANVAKKSAGELGDWFRQQDEEASSREIVTSGWGCDVSSEKQVQDTISAIVAHHGKIDVLVTSAGFTENFAAQDYPIDRVRKLMSVNVDGTFLCAQMVARHLIETKRHGSMIFIGSMSGSIVNIPQPQAPYNASKAAVKHLAASMAVEWAKYGIRVNSIAPGYMLTALTKVILDGNPELKRTWEGLTPMGEMGNPDDLKGAVVFLASEASRYVTGTELKVDGGYTIT